jgi:hypothetical protein
MRGSSGTPAEWIPVEAARWQCPVPQQAAKIALDLCLWVLTVYGKRAGQFPLQSAWNAMCPVVEFHLGRRLPFATRAPGDRHLVPRQSLLGASGPLTG